MSFFENIIADSRRKIVPVQDVAPISKVAPMDSHSSASSVTDPKTRKINLPDTVTHADVGMPLSAKPNETQVSHDALFKSSANTSRGKTSNLTDAAANIVSPAPKASKSLAGDKNHVTPSSVPAMQLKANTNSRSATVSAAVSNNRFYRKFLPPSNKSPLSYYVGDKQASLAHHQHSRQEQPVVKQAAATPDLSKTREMPLNSSLRPHHIEPGEASRMKVNQLNTQREQSEQTTEAIPAKTEVQNVSATILTKNRAALPKERERPHIEANHKNLPRVQIGQVNVIIEQKDMPNRRTNKVLERDDYASRNFLKSL